MPVRAKDFEADRRVGGDGPCLDQSGQIADVIGMEMGDELDANRRQRQSGFAQTHKAARTGVHHDARHSIDKDEMAGSRSPGRAGPA